MAAATGASRPVRALVVVLGGWIAVRTGLLWAPAANLSLASVKAMPGPGQAKGATLLVLRPRPLTLPVAAHRTAERSMKPAAARPAPHHVRPIGAAVDLFGALPDNVRTHSESLPPAALPRLDGPQRGARRADRLSGSAWLIERPGSTNAALSPGGTLGGSQAGVRLFYEPGPRGFALTGRISTPLAANLGREVSIGVGWRGAQGGVLIERRVALDRGARNAVTLTAYGGIDDVALPGGLRFGGYAQAGIVGLRSPDGFVDGAARVVRPVAAPGRARIAIGTAVSGGAQPGVSRLDVGPALTTDAALGPATLRVSLEWRHRIAGTAAPGSGAVLGIGMGF